MQYGVTFARQMGDAIECASATTYIDHCSVPSACATQFVCLVDDA